MILFLMMYIREAGIFEKMSFEEFCDNIEEDEGEFEFTDDLIYIYGIAKY